MSKNMHKKTVVFLLACAFCVLFVTTGVSANVIVFDEYNTQAIIQGDSITISRDVRIKNIGNSPIIPGELHFRLFDNRGGERRPLDVTTFTAQAATGESLSTKVTTKAEETDLSVHLWNPLLPTFHYDFTMEYELAFSPSGILFYELRLPQEETTIPIRNQNLEFVLDDRYHVTYAPGSEVSKLQGNVVVSWDEEEQGRIVEYSRIPLPRTGVRAVNVFWVLIILLLAGYFVFSIRRNKRGQQSEPPQGPPPTFTPGPRGPPPQRPPQHMHPPRGPPPTQHRGGGYR